MSTNKSEMTHDAADEQLHRVRHSLSHVLAQAVQQIRPGARLGFGPPIADGFYYDFILPQPITEEDFPEIEKRMKHIIKQNQPFEREELPREYLVRIIKRCGGDLDKAAEEAGIHRKSLERLLRQHGLKAADFR